MQDIDLKALAEFLRGTRDSRKLNLREVAAQTGISASTLSRIERAEAQPDLRTVRAIVSWLGVPLERVVTGVAKARRTAKQEPSAQASAPLNQVEVQFRADPKLSPDAAEALIKIVRAAYTQMVQTSTKK
jgi:transcriptional regulator with XRE-family HTH domain